MKNKFLVFAFVVFFFPLSASAYTITSGVTGTALSNGFGNTVTWQKNAVEFTTTGTGDVSEILVAVSKELSPSDSGQVEIYANSGGVPSGSALASGTFNPAGLTSEVCSDVNVTLSAPVTLSASTEYWIVFSRTSTLDDTDYYFTCGVNSSTTGYDTKGYNGAVWGSAMAQTYKFSFDVVEPPVPPYTFLGIPSVGTMIFLGLLWKFITLYGVLFVLWLFARIIGYPLMLFVRALYDLV